MNSFRETIQFYLVDSKTPLGKRMHRTVRAAGMLSIRNTKTVSLFKEQGSRKKVQGYKYDFELTTKKKEKGEDKV